MKISKLPKINSTQLSYKNGTIVAGLQYIDSDLELQYDEIDIVVENFCMSGYIDEIELELCDNLKKEYPQIRSVKLCGLYSISFGNRKITCKIDWYYLNKYDTIEYIGILDYRNRRVLQSEYLQVLERINKL